VKNIFVYGSLIFDEVWAAIASRQYRTQYATLEGYARYRVKAETYPGLVRSPSGRVQGLVRMGVTVADVRKLDQFEGDEYRRRPMWVTTGHGTQIRVETYVIRLSAMHRLTRKHWDPEWFRDNGLENFLARYSGTVRV